MKKAILYRMQTPDHICPFGIKSKDLLERQGYQVEDHHLHNRAEIKEFQKIHDVSTTPQIFIAGHRIGGYDALLKYFKKTTIKPEEQTYQPVIAIFGVAFLMAIAITYLISGMFVFIKLIEFFVAISMCFLGVMKLKNLYAFSNQFITYDLLGMRYVRYAYVYPFIETGAGILMLAGIFLWVSIPATLFIGVVGAVSVIKAVYIDKRQLNCACVGGDGSVPLGFLSLAENIMMIAIALWLIIKHCFLSV